jgi:hypothetical protein
VICKWGAATVRIDPERIDPAALLKARVEPQYTIRLPHEVLKSNPSTNEQP